MIALGLALLLISGSAQAVVYREPDTLRANFSLSLDNISEYSTMTVNLTNSDMDYIDNIGFQSEYVFDYDPKGMHIAPNNKMEFFLLIGVSDVNESQIITGKINVTGEDETGNVTVGEIPFIFTIESQLMPTKEYLYRKCFVEQGEEFCKAINLSELTNITVTTSIMSTVK